MSMLTPERFMLSLKKNAVILKHILRDVTQERALRLTDGPDGWNAVEVVCHLRDYDEIYFERLRLIAEKEKPSFPVYDHLALVKERNYAGQHLDEVLLSFAAGRAQLVEWLEKRPEPDWARTGIHATWGEITLLEQAIFITWHDVNHIEQIARILDGG